MPSYRKSSISRHDEQIRATLAKAHRREGDLFEGDDAPPDPLGPSDCELFFHESVEPEAGALRVLAPSDEIEEREERPEGDEMRIKSEAVDALLGWVFKDGPHPCAAMKRLYTLAQHYSPRLISNLNGTEIAALFGQGRAAQSARTAMLLNKPMKAQGFRNWKTPSQKGQNTSAAFSRAQLGNKNRAGIPQRAAA
jgi:hypothetical protein